MSQGLSVPNHETQDADGELSFRTRWTDKNGANPRQQLLEQTRRMSYQAHHHRQMRQIWAHELDGNHVPDMDGRGRVRHLGREGRRTSAMRTVSPFAPEAAHKAWAHPVALGVE